MSRITPELIDSFLGEAVVYLDSIEQFFSEQTENETTDFDTTPLIGILDNLKSASDFVGLKGPSFAAQRFSTLLDQAKHEKKSDISNLYKWSEPLINALKKMLIKISEGNLSACEMIGEELEDSWQMPFVTVETRDSSLTDELVDIFVKEAEENLEGMKISIDSLVYDPFNNSMSSKLFGHMLNLKGAAAMADQQAFTQLLDLMISTQEAIEKGRFKIDQNIINFFTGGLSVISEMLVRIKNDQGDTKRLFLDFKNQSRDLLPQNLLNALNHQDDTEFPDFSESPEDEFDEDAFFKELQKVFKQEASEHLKNFRQLIVKAEKKENSSELIHQMFRVIHTLKGSSATAGYQTLSDCVHGLENLLDGFRESDRKIDGDFIGFLYKVEILLGEILDSLETDKSNIEQKAKKLNQAIQLYGGNLSQQAATDDSTIFEPEPEPAEDSATTDRVVKVPISKLDHLMNIVSEMNSYRLRLREVSDSFSELNKKLKWERRNLNKIVGDYQKKHQWDMPLPGLPNPDHGEFSDLEFDRYSDLAIFSRNMEDIDDKISDVLKQLEGSMVRFNEDSGSISSLITGLKDEMIQVRMVHVEHLFKRVEFQTMRLARMLDKKIRVDISGGQTEIDKSIMDSLVDPLGHIIRNCLDHGIEPVETRKQLGKQETGIIRFTAAQEERSVVIQIEDDGQGIDVDKIAEAAVKHGILKKEELETKTDEDLMNLIFYPQISIKSSAGPISGRGVGMDAVRHSIAEMYGSIHIDSKKGRGTRFIIRLPLTLAVQPILGVKCEPYAFNLPMHYVEKLVEPEEVKPGEAENTCVYREEEIPMRWLARFLRLPHDTELGSSPAIIVKNGERKMALMVDGVFSREEVIIRPLSSLFESSLHFLGSTITPAGEVRLVLNLPYLFEMHENLPALSAPKYSPEERIKVLIADDSLSVRKNIKFMLGKHGIKANTAKDGLLAWQKMHNIKPDLLIVDLEMPNLNGFELMERVRQSAEFSNLPLLVLTSRAGAKHHQKAMACGADGFLSKPVLEREMMARIRNVLPHSLRDLLDERDLELAK